MTISEMKIVFCIDTSCDVCLFFSLLAICSSDNFQDQMKRELSYREEMVQQLHIVRGETNKAEGADTAALRHAFTFLDLLSQICRRD